jgi:DNA-cytosine methyltransferase
MSKGINVLSLFDGMSCGQIALEKANIKVNKYYASEIDKNAIKVTKNNYPNTIHIGNVTKVFAKDLEKIDLLIGGSPCQGFSFAGKQLAFDDPRSVLFFEFVRLWNEIKEINPNVKFLLENVRMKKEHEKVISDYLGLEPMFICSSLFSAQQRKRLYWSNINTIETMFAIKTHFDLPKDKGLKLIDILENKQNGQEAVEISKQKRNGNHILESSFNDKSNSLTTFEHNSMVGIFPVNEDFYLNDDNIKKAKNYKGARTFKTGNSRGDMPFPNKLNWKSLCLTTTNGSSRTVNFVDDGFGVRRLTPLEWERLQTVPENYTNFVPKSHRYKMLGNGWTIDVIEHIFKYL